jgi:hypothetical protein
VAPFAKGLDDPKGLAASRDAIFVADKTRIWKIDMNGSATVFVKAESFPQPPGARPGHPEPERPAVRKHRQAAGGRFQHG